MSWIQTSQLASTNGFCAGIYTRREKKVYHIIRKVRRANRKKTVFTVCGTMFVDPELFDVLDDIDTEQYYSCTTCFSTRRVHA